jgi:hypothetical protein
MAEPERFLTIGQAAELVGYDEATVLGWARNGLPTINPNPDGRRCRREKLRVRRSALLDFVRGLEVVRAPKAEPDAAAAPKARAKGAARTLGLSAWREGRGA